MKVLHVADLHFGKSLAGQSLLADQRDWMEKFIALVEDERPRAVVVAGDVYDRAAPGEDAVALLDEFLTRLLATSCEPTVFVVAGNHDSGRKLAFGSAILKKQRLHIVGEVSAELEHVELADDQGPVVFWLLPYTFPAAIQEVLCDESPRSYTAAVKALLDRQPLDPAVRNVLVAHQSVLFDGQEAEQGGSETMIGGVGGVDGRVFDVFDYVALGHIHKAQTMGRPTLRYAGSPLCYHFDEVKGGLKGAVCVELGAKGQVGVEVKKIAPLHPLRVVEGAFEEILAREGANPAGGEYVKIVLTDRRVRPSEADALRALFTGKGSLALEILSSHCAFTATGGTTGTAVPERPLDEKFLDFWKARHGGAEPDAETQALVRRAAELVASQRGAVEDDADRLVAFAVEGV